MEPWEDEEESGDMRGVLVLGEMECDHEELVIPLAKSAKGEECFSGMRWEARCTWKSL
jgi:hypothetical protein